jgi:hypothetical protein
MANQNLTTAEVGNIVADAESSENLYRLVRLCRSGPGVVPFVGAGMSMSFGMRGWTNFLRHRGGLVGTAFQENIERRIQSGEYEEAAEDLLSELGENRLVDAVEAEFGPAKLQGIQLGGAVAWVPRLSRGPVITTNFDIVLERTFEQAGRAFKAVIRGVDQDMTARAVYENERFLLKIHGDARSRTERVLTLSEYERTYGRIDPLGGPEAERLPPLLEQIFVSRSLLFLGCSLEHDRTVAVLKRAARHIRLNHYAIVERPKGNEVFRDRRSQLWGMGIRPIFYAAGKHGLIADILAYVAERSVWTAGARAGLAEIADQDTRILLEHSRVFVSRTGEIATLDAFLKQHARGILLIHGGAGLGKTALLANWILSRNDERLLIAHHCFNSRATVGRSPAEAYAHLLLQIWEEGGGTREALPGDEWQLRSLLYSVLRQPRLEDSPRLVLVFDALDEADRPVRPPIAAGSLGEGVYLIASARGGEIETEFTRGWTTGANLLELSGLEESAVGEWLGRNAKLQSFSTDAQFANTLYRKTGGFPLYLHFLIEEMARAADNPAEVRRIANTSPAGFGRYVREQWVSLAAAVEVKGNRGVQKVFALLSVAAGPLSTEEIAELTELSPWDLAALPWQTVRWFTIRDTVGHSSLYAFAHPLLASEFRQLLGPDAKSAFERLLDYCARWRSTQSLYALRYYAFHLRTAGRTELLFELACDTEYVNRQAGTFPADPDLSLRTVQEALSAAADIDDAELMARCLLLHACRTLTAASESPLEALQRTGILERAWSLSDRREHQQRALWHVLLMWELLVEGRPDDARRTRERLTARPLPRLEMSERSVGVSVFAALLVAYRTELGEIWKQMFDDPKGVLRELIAQRQFGLAREVAREIGSEEASWRTLRAVALGLETEGRLADALSTAAEIGGRKEREFTQLLLLEAHAKKTAEIDVDEAELELMETAALNPRAE